MYELIIIGAGPAGMAAAVYAARQKLNFIVISENVGGQAIWSADVENYIGYQVISGQELSNKFYEHIKQYNVGLKQGERVKDIRQKGREFVIETNKDSYEAKTVVITSGKKPRKLNVPGEDEYKGKGVTYCATCDGPLFQGKDVAVLGGGNAGVDAALQMSKIAKKVYLIEKTGKLKAERIASEKCELSENIEILLRTDIKEIFGKDFVEGIKIKNKDEEKEIELQGIFVEIGSIPSVDFAKTVKKNEANEIIVNNKNETNIPGLFAAGDVTDVPEKQIIVAAGEGAKAALSAFKYISKS